MKKRMKYILLLNLFLCNLGMAQINLSTDLSNSVDYPAFNRELIIDVNGDTMAGYAFIAAGEALKETILLLHGYPGFDNNFDLAQIIRRNGYNVISFNYRGAWGSQGNYLYSNCLEDVQYVLNYLTQAEISQKLRIQSNAFTLLGRSYGGGIALIQGAQLAEVKNVIAISSTNYGYVFQKYKTLEELGSYQRYMHKQVMINTDVDEFLIEMLDNRAAFDVQNYTGKLQSKNVLCIEDSDRNDDWLAKISNAEILKMETDHGFIDKRMELVTVIIEWLNKS